MKFFDYTSARTYFVTINCHKNLHLLGKIVTIGDSKQIVLSEIGTIAYQRITELSSHHPGVEVLDFVVMPNHIHILLSFQNQVIPSSLSTIIGSYKSGVSRLARKAFPGLDLWQASFFDHVIKDERDLLVHYDYIRMNVDRWQKDKYFVFK